MSDDSIETVIGVEPPEPWLRGPLAGIHLLVAPVLHAFAQAREDLAHWTQGLSDAEIWSQPNGLASVGFHLRHIAGSVERLTTYLRGEQLTPQQLEALGHESDPGPGRLALLDEINRSLVQSEQVISALDPATLGEARAVGRKRLPTTVIGLAIHLAEHTQRHVGELIVTAKVARRSQSGRTRSIPS
jgi:DinB superfamily